VALYSTTCALTQGTTFVDVAGKVGLGTAAPTSPLQVAGAFGSAAVNQC